MPTKLAGDLLTTWNIRFSQPPPPLLAADDAVISTFTYCAVCLAGGTANSILICLLKSVLLLICTPAPLQSSESCRQTSLR